MTYQLTYRTGGTQAFEWRPVLERYPDMESAVAAAQPLVRMGYPCAVLPADAPLPTTYLPKARPQ